MDRRAFLAGSLAGLIAARIEETTVPTQSRQGDFPFGSAPRVPSCPGNRVARTPRPQPDRPSRQ